MLLHHKRSYLKPVTVLGSGCKFCKHVQSGSGLISTGISLAKRFLPKLIKGGVKIASRLLKKSGLKAVGRLALREGKDFVTIAQER